MRLSHKKKLAHKRSGAAKGWALVLLSRRRISHISMMSVSINGEPIKADSIGIANMRALARSAEHAGSLMNKLVGEVASTFRRLREAGAAQADIIRGRIG
ncbi:hypothetical protein [Aeromonas sobria]|uniref:hypothetical protein n=1 Tax=Aeromonas sobria TaxID=646 RepID=UPI0026EAEA0B|nr:hypothetical protein [Aeromonas sobria]